MGLRSVFSRFGLARDTSHLGASVTSREVAGWDQGAQSADADLLGELETITGRARDLDRNNPLAQNVRVVKGDSIIGTGLQVSPIPNWRVLEPALLADPEWVAEWGERGAAAWAADWSTRVKAHWNDYSETAWIDYDGHDNFSAQTRLMYDSAFLNGSAIAIPMWERRPGTPYRTCLRIIESDRLCNPMEAEDTAKIAGGIERDARGRVVAYHVRNAHPGDLMARPDHVVPKWERIPATRPNGRRAFIHMFTRDRPGQSRGKAAATAVLAAFGLSGKYQLTELQAAVVNSKVAGVLETPLSDDQAIDLFGGDKKDYKELRKNFRGELTAGTILNLPPGTKFSSHIPGRPSTGYAAFMQQVGREIGAGFFIPYELSHRDFSKTSYHSARAALLEAWRHFHVERRQIEFRFACPVYELVLEEMISLGRIKAPRYYENRAAYGRCKWLAQGQYPIDDLRHQKAITEGLMNGSKTRQQVAEETGEDWVEKMEQSFREAQQEQEFEQLFGVTLRKPGQAQASTVGESLDGDTTSGDEELDEIEQQEEDEEAAEAEEAENA